MGEYYSHLLIPQRSDFAPSVAQVVKFLRALEGLGSAPLKPIVKLSIPSEKITTFSDPLTGEERSFRHRKYSKYENLGEAASSLIGIEDYSVILSGEGPPQLSPFPLFAASDSQWRSVFTNSYYFEVSCDIRPAAISLSKGSWLEPCTSDKTVTIISNPWNLRTIRVSNSGCARFWITFHFGKFLVPKIEDSLDLLAPALPNLAFEEFGIAFTQSCFYG
jgi:hypothetical protein